MKSRVLYVIGNGFDLFKCPPWDTVCIVVCGLKDLPINYQECQLRLVLIYRDGLVEAVLKGHPPLGLKVGHVVQCVLPMLKGSEKGSLELILLAPGRCLDEKWLYGSGDTFLLQFLIETVQRIQFGLRREARARLRCEDGSVFLIQLELPNETMIE